MYALSLVQVLMSKCPLYIHATPPPDWFSLHLSNILHPSPEMLASSICRSSSVWIQVSIIKHISMSFKVMSRRRASILELINCMFIINILMGVWFHFVILHLGNVQSRCWWTPLFEDHVLALFLPPLLPLNLLFNANSLILSRVLTSNLCVELLSEIDDVLAGKCAWQMNFRAYFDSDLFTIKDMFWNSFVPEEFSAKAN